MGLYHLNKNEVVFAVMAICLKIHSIYNVFMVSAIFCKFLMRIWPLIDLA